MVITVRWYVLQMFVELKIWGGVALRIFISHFLLFCFCCTMFFQICSNNIAIIAMLCSLFVLSLSYFFSQTNVSLLLFALYAVLALFQKEFVIFFPMLTFFPFFLPPFVNILPLPGGTCNKKIANIIFAFFSLSILILWHLSY